MHQWVKPPRLLKSSERWGSVDVEYANEVDG